MNRSLTKLFCIFLCVIINLSFVACGINNDPLPQVSSEESAETPAENTSESAEIPDEDNEKGFVFLYEDHEIYMGMPEEVIKLIEGYTNPGVDQTEVMIIRYEFSSFYADCTKWFLSNEPFIVSVICFKDDTVETMEGIRIGDSREKVMDTYKNDEVLLSSDNQIHFLRGNSVLTFGFTDNKVTEILYEYHP